MSQLPDFTLIIILHNRHRNLDRLLEYYENAGFPILIADSSLEPHVFQEGISMDLQYVYTPGLTYTQKVENALSFITTKYVALCADDDFIVPSGIAACVAFLNGHADYVTAQGAIARYYKPEANQQKIRFDMLYMGDFTINENDPIVRLSRLFQPYKSLLYAVHRVSVLQSVFKNAGDRITNLYLNEYLTSIGPVLLGKTKDLDCLYQVREHAIDSDDKTAENLDVITGEKKYEAEAARFIALLVNNTSGTSGSSETVLQNAIKEALEGYVYQLKKLQRPKIPFRKRVGTLLYLIPYFGPRYIQANRLKQSNKRLALTLGAAGIEQVEKIGSMVRKY